MKVQCPNCGHSVVVSGLGRKRLDIPLKNILDMVSRHTTVASAAGELGCSEAYIFGVLKANGLKLKDVVSATKDTRLLHKRGLNE